MARNFNKDRNGYVNVYTDGACPNNGREGAQAGIGVYFGDNHALNVSEPVRGRQTNNTAEIQAATRAINVAKAQGETKVHVNTDSKFTHDCATKWMPTWEQNGWTKADGKPVQNRGDLEKLGSAMGGMDVKWSHVDGHRGHHGNEMADGLARAGAKRRDY